MALGKQAKTLSKNQIETVLAYLSSGRYPIRDKVIFLLSVKAGLRAMEIANLKWEMILTPDGAIGHSIHLTNVASKGRSGGRIIPLNKDLRSALNDLKTSGPPDRPSQYIVTTERSVSTSAQVIVNLFTRLYVNLGYTGCSSHSGRRTFITNAARKISTVGGSLRDVQVLAGHSNLSSTQRYIEADAAAQRRIVELV